ncbi:FFLEELY motif protein [Paenacidovorax monticola]|uniref:DUF8198 domain-containing protein n=1 Tax=Paenacidovorax monticola TaxID=1926868 RepID=A0A7H0HE65_9BURK|nr:hypothetical protein [Paenacidovorax monticola]QNP58831.1 hypothetical protein H9L24_18115 [Paenacidovorax monticola]
MDAAHTIRHCITNVTALRQQRATHPAWRQAVHAIKELQSRRFQGTYADLLATPRYAPATRFFLQELYGSADYQARDAQFGRIAGALQTLFPQPVVATAVALAQLHAQTEQLDHAMGQAWAEMPGDDAARYVAAWRAVGQPHARREQLGRVLDMGRDLARLTRTPGLRTMLRMMRRPAHAAGMGELQRFLEAGFDTFGELARQRGAVEHFLDTIGDREAALMEQLFQDDPTTCEALLERTLQQRPSR